MHYSKNYGCFPFKYDKGPIFQVSNLHRYLTQIRPSEIHYQPSPTARNGSLDLLLPEMSMTDHKCVLIVSRINFGKRFFYPIAKFEIL